jgi:trimethylamine--corrinoid protein Co-methyltransferase
MLDDEALAVSVIDQVGPGGEFLTHDHTMNHWREFWLPQIFLRQSWEKWEAQGSKDARAVVREKTLHLLDTHQPEPLPDSVSQELDRILAKSAA